MVNKHRRCLSIIVWPDAITKVVYGILQSVVP